MTLYRIITFASMIISALGAVGGNESDKRGYITLFAISGALILLSYVLLKV